MHTPHVKLPCVMALTLLAVRPAGTQVGFDVGPLVALYAPTAGFDPAYYSTALPNAPSDLSGVAWGGEGRLWLGQRFGLQIQAAVAASSVGGGNTPGGPAPATPARVLTATVQALYTVYAKPRTARVWLGVGGGLVRHGGTAYAPYGAPASPSGALGLGSAIPVSRHLSATIGLNTLLYYMDLRDSNRKKLERGFQVDALVHLGLSWARRY